MLGALHTICGELDDQATQVRDGKLFSTVMGTPFLIPVIGSVDERRPPTALDLAEAKETMTLPAVAIEGRGRTAASSQQSLDYLTAIHGGDKLPSSEAISA